MNKIKLIIKGILLYVTIFAIILLVTGIDSICENGYFIYSILICILLCYACYKSISKEEAEILTFTKIYNKIIGGKDNE